LRAVVFGQSGLQKDAYLEEARRLAAPEHDFKIVNLGDRMCAVDPGKRDPQLYPSLPVYEREALRNHALEKIIREVKSKPKKDYVLNAHAVFKTDSGLVPATGASLISKFAPEVVIVMIDDFHYVHRRLQQTPYADLSLREILEWRDQEIVAARVIAQELFGAGGDLQSRFFLLARGHHPRVLLRLLYERDKRLRIYASFAMTNATSDEQKKISEFKAHLAEKHVVFDPAKIVERGMITLAGSVIEEMAERVGSAEAVRSAHGSLVEALSNLDVKHPNFVMRKNFVPTEVLPGLGDLVYRPTSRDGDQREDKLGQELLEPYTYPLDEVDALQAAVDGQIHGRDYMMIDQSDVVCALVSAKSDGKTPNISAGSQTELTYAKQTLKGRFVVWGGDMSKLSPWVENKKFVFKTLDDLEKALDNRARKLSRNIRPPARTKG
jgi:adenylate kinase